MTAAEVLELARLCRQQARLTADPQAATVLGDLAGHYEALAPTAVDEPGDDLAAAQSSGRPVAGIDRDHQDGRGGQ